MGFLDRIRTSIGRNYPVAIAGIVCLALGVGCGEEKGGSTVSVATGTSDERRTIDLPPTEQVSIAASTWAALFGSGDLAACDLMRGVAVGACETTYLDGKQSSFVKSFRNAEIEKIDVNGGKASVVFDTGEGVELRGDPTLGDWLVVDIGGNAGQRDLSSSRGAGDAPDDADGSLLPPPRVAGNQVNVPSYLADPLKFTTLIDKYLRLNWGRDSGNEQSWARKVTVFANNKGIATVINLDIEGPGDDAELLCEAVASSGYYELVVVKRPFGGGAITNCDG